jgi:hypothetical protein
MRRRAIRRVEAERAVGAEAGPPMPCVQRDAERIQSPVKNVISARGELR